jgi:hypothetical protein
VILRLWRLTLSSKQNALWKETMNEGTVHLGEGTVLYGIVLQRFGQMFHYKDPNEGSKKTPKILSLQSVKPMSMLGKKLACNTKPYLHKTLKTIFKKIISR